MNKHTLSFFHPLRITLCAAISLGLGACVGGDKDTSTVGDSIGDSDSDSDSDSSTGSTTEDPSVSGTSTGGPGTDSESASTGQETLSTSGETITDGTDGTDPTDPTDPTDTTGGTTEGTTEGTTGGDGSIPESCAQACEVVYECNPEEYESIEGCIAECTEGSTIPDASDSCEAAIVGFNLCLSMATCEDIEDEAVCLEEQEEIEGACDLGDECIMGVGGDAESCGILEDCGDSSMELKCEGKECLCLEDGEQVGSCTNDVCADELDADALYDKAFECCGFEF